MSRRHDFDLAAALERHLGDPRGADQLFSYAARVADDEAQVYPEPCFQWLNAWGLHHYYVPAALGGRLTRFDELGALLRTASRRDLSVSISHAVSFLGAMCVWLQGEPQQQRTLARRLLGGERISLALTEKSHGGDLLAVETQARPGADGFVLDGEKWLINGATRNSMALVLARSDDRGGPRGLSLFLLDRASAQGRCAALPKVETLGVRGADISGLRFEAVRLPAAAQVGGAGGGFETVLKGLQLSRILCGALSLGAGDTCLDVVLDFALRRRIYARTAADLPQVQRLVTEAWADLLIAESLCGVALRALQFVPQQASVYSTVVKYLAPTLVEQALQKLSTVLGARFYLRHEHAGGIFQKMLRDNLLIGLFDGSTVVNLYTLSFQLRSLLARAAEGPADRRAYELADRGREVPPFDWSGLSLSSSGQDSVFAAFAPCCEALRQWLAPRDGLAEGAARDALERLREAPEALAADMRQLSPQRQAAGEPLLFDLARRYAVTWALSSVLLNWRLNRAELGGTLAEPEVLALLLGRFEELLGRPAALPAAVYRAAFARLLARRESGAGAGLYAAGDSGEPGDAVESESLIETI